MFSSNPFAELAVFLPPIFMQVYIVAMIVAVAAGTLVDMLHKGSAKYFLQQRARSKANATRHVGIGERLSLAIRTLLMSVASRNGIRVNLEILEDEEPSSASPLPPPASKKADEEEEE